MSLIESMEHAETEVRRRFAARAEELRQDWEQSFHDALPGNHSPAEAILLAHLMTATDGFNSVSFCTNWDSRLKAGWQTSVVYLARLDEKLIVPFALEARFDDHARQLAVLIDRERPGERSVEKLQRDKALMARDYRVFSLTELEILTNPEECRVRIEDVLFKMAEEALIDAGKISGFHKET